MASKKNYLIFLIGFLAISAAAYYLMVVRSDGRYIDAGSIGYYVLVPDIIKQLPLDPDDQIISYYYSAADGSRPAVVSVAFTTEKPIGQFYTALVDYFDALGFQNIDAVYKKDAMEIFITHTVGDEDAVLINVALLEHSH